MDKNPGIEENDVNYDEAAIRRELSRDEKPAVYLACPYCPCEVSLYRGILWRAYCSEHGTIVPIWRAIP